MAVEPLKASLIADLVGLINENLGQLLHVKIMCCPDCRGSGVTFVGAAKAEMSCETCGGAAAIERYELDQAKLQTERFGRHIEQFEYKQGQYVPKFRSKDKSFALLVRMLGLEKALIEIANAAPLSATISDHERAAYVEQLKELAAMGLLDGQ